MNRKIAVLILMVASALFLVWPSRAVLSSLSLKKTGVQTESIVTGVRRVSKKGLPEVSVAFTDAEGKHAEARALYFPPARLAFFNSTPSVLTLY